MRLNAHICAWFLCVLCAVSSRPALAQQAEIDAHAEERNALRYASCLERARSDPNAAVTLARNWLDNDGGLPAGHCHAVAIFNLGRYEEAALGFEELAGHIAEGRTFEIFNPVADAGAWNQLLPGLYGQAGNAWILAGQPARAAGLFDQALGELAKREQPNPVARAELLIDRARSLAELTRWQSALADLELAWRLSGDRADLHLYRASALRHLGRLADALAAVDTALALEPDLPAALLERGNIKHLSGDGKGAQNDWLAVLSAAPGSDSAKAAQGNLARLELSKNQKVRGEEGGD